MQTTRVATVQTTPRAHAGPRATRRFLIVLAATAATLAVWVIAGPIADIGLMVKSGSGPARQVGPGAVVITTLVVGLAGWGLLALLERFTHRGRSVWCAVAAVVLVLSLLGPISSGTTGMTTATLVVMHLAAATVLIALLPGSAGRR